MHFLILCSFLTQFKAGFLSEVTLTAPSYVRIGERFALNCTSSQTPQIQSAEFLLNGRTVTNIGSRDGKCYNAITSDTCTPVMCHCSSDRRSYSYIYQPVTMTTTNVFACKMKISDTALEVSNNVTTYIVEPPQMILNDSFYCNGSSSVMLVCRIQGGFNEFGFSSWEHYFNGTFIRQLKGFVQGQLSILQINSCNFQDTGKYICQSWSIFSEEILSTNVTTKVLVEERPVVINKTAQLTTGLMFVVFLYSPSDMVFVNWYLDSNIILNISEYEQNTERTYVDITIHGQLVHTNGFKSSLKCPRTSFSHKKYTVCATNIYGEVCNDFQDNTEVPKSTNLFWIIGGIVTVVLIIGLVTVIVTLHIRYKTQVHTFLTQEDTDRSEQVERARYSRNALFDRIDISQYVQANSPIHDVHSYHRASYVCDRVDSLSKNENVETSAMNTYMEVQPDSASSSEESDAYEKVD